MTPKTCPSCSKLTRRAAFAKTPSAVFATPDPTAEHPALVCCPHCESPSYAPDPDSFWWCRCQICHCSDRPESPSVSASEAQRATTTRRWVADMHELLSISRPLAEEVVRKLEHRMSVLECRVDPYDGGFLPCEDLSTLSADQLVRRGAHLHERLRANPLLRKARAIQDIETAASRLERAARHLQAIGCPTGAVYDEIGNIQRLVGVVKALETATEPKEDAHD